MLPVIYFILFFLGVALIIVGQKTKNRDAVFGGWGIPGLILTIIFGICVLTWPIDYFSSYTQIADLEAFYESNRQNYSVVVEQTKQAVIRLEQESMLQISVENLKQSTNWSERIRELRDKTIWYNRELKRLQRFNESGWLFLLFADPPKELKPIILER